MLDELRTWWQNTSPENQAYLQDGALALGALLVGHFLGAMVARALRARDFDGALRLGGPPPGAEAGRGITPTLLAGLLVRLTVWGGAAWWLAHKHGRHDLAATLALVLSRTWAVSAMLVAALALGTLLARRLVECLHGLPGDAPVAPSRLAAGAAAPQRGVAGAAAAVVYVLALLLVLLMAADAFDWPLTRSSALALWSFTHHLLVAGSALLIGSLGARWARDLATPDGAASPEKRAGQYTGLVVMAATTVLAVVVLLSSAGVLLGIAALALFGLVLWMGRDHLPDVTAGLQLRAHKVSEVWLEGEAWQVAEVGFLTSQVGRRGEFRPLPNRQVLEARLHAAPPAEAPRANGPAEARHR